MKNALIFLTVSIVVMVSTAGYSEISAEKKSDMKKDNPVIVVTEKNVVDDTYSRTLVREGDSNCSENESRMYRMYAQAPTSERSEFRGGFPFGPGGDESRGFKARLMIMYRLVEHLDLTEETATKFFPLYMTFLNDREKLMKEHREIIHSIVDGADNQSVSVRDLKKKIEEMKANEQAMYSQRNDFFAKAEKILNERQYIKLVVFNDMLKEDLLLQFRSDRRYDDSRSSQDVQKMKEESDKSKSRSEKK